MHLICFIIENILLKCNHTNLIMSTLQGMSITSKMPSPNMASEILPKLSCLTSHPQVPVFSSAHLTLALDLLPRSPAVILHMLDALPWNSLCLSVTGKLQLTLQKPPKRDSHWRSSPCLPALVLRGGHTIL